MSEKERQPFWVETHTRILVAYGDLYREGNVTVLWRRSVGHTQEVFPSIASMFGIEEGASIVALVNFYPDLKTYEYVGFKDGNEYGLKVVGKEEDYSICRYDILEKQEPQPFVVETKAGDLIAYGDLFASTGNVILRWRFGVGHTEEHFASISQMFGVEECADVVKLVDNYPELETDEPFVGYVKGEAESWRAVKGEDGEGVSFSIL